MKDGETNGFIPLTNLDPQTFEKTITKLDHLWKTKSIVLLDKFGLPTPSAFAITSWDKNIKQKLLEFCKKMNWNSVVIRTDKERETGENIPRGGYLVNTSDLEEEIQKHLRNKRIVIILEPRDHYKNLYGINVLYDANNPDELYFEIVGPGFEVSNLNRGDIIPHEKLILKRQNDNFIILKHEIISDVDYKNSVKLRYQQIGRSILGKNNSITSDLELVKTAKQFLKKNRYQLLEKNEKK